MINYQIKTLIILPHLDDEFALAPIIKKLIYKSIHNVAFIYCAERNNSGNSKYLRRNENLRALGIIGCLKQQVIYLNDYFFVDDLKLIDAASEINSFINSYIEKNNFKQLITLNFEGGHPDHDSLALIINKIAMEHKYLTAYFVPAYNSRSTMILPISVLRPLKSQLPFFTKEVYSLFCWLDSLKIAYAYKSEKLAFIKLLPFILFKLLCSKSIFISNEIHIHSVDWKNSLSLMRYKVKWDYIKIKIDNL